MNEYISREKLRQHLLDDIEACNDPDACESMVNYGFELGLKHALSFVDTLLAEDVAEVRHGAWIEKQIPLEWCEDDVDIVFECSICKVETPFTSDYCPNCGTKMDKGVIYNE